MIVLATIILFIDACVLDQQVHILQQRVRFGSCIPQFTYESQCKRPELITTSNSGPANAIVMRASRSLLTRKLVRSNIDFHHAAALPRLRFRGRSYLRDLLAAARSGLI